MLPGRLCRLIRRFGSAASVIGVKATSSRLAAGLSGGAFALLAVSVAILGTLSLYLEPGPDTKGHANHWLLGWAAYSFTILAIFAFCAVASVILLRFTQRGPELRNLRDRASPFRPTAVCPQNNLWNLHHQLARTNRRPLLVSGAKRMILCEALAGSM
jgi:hypothetical protein